MQKPCYKYKNGDFLSQKNNRNWNQWWNRVNHCTDELQTDDFNVFCIELISKNLGGLLAIA